MKFGMVKLLAAAGLVAVTVGQEIPFVLPWDDASPGVTDFSGLNTPIGPEDRVTVNAAGQFERRGQRVRFLGVNFAGDSPFMPTNRADAVAARLAKFGINCVRFHHLDAPWAYNGGLLAYTPTSSTNFNAAQFQRLQFLISRLKARGIYANLNLLVGRQYRSGDGLGSAVTAMDWKDSHILGFFHDTALALQKDYATRLLTPTNPFTGLPLARDPAVAFVEIINENGLLQKWLEGALDRLPTAYAPLLRARWNDWLAARYADDAALRAAWGILDEPLGANLLRNGDFAGGLTDWNTEQHGPARATFTRTFEFANNAPSARITVTQTGSESWHIQFNQAGLRLTNTRPYTLSFWARASQSAELWVAVQRAYGDYGVAGYAETLPLSTNWQQVTRAFTAPATDTNLRVNFGGMGRTRATWWLADVRLQPGGKVGELPESASLAARNLPIVHHSGAGYTGTSGARRDWVRFLRDLEHRYYDAMVTHVRKACGYPGIVFGTIMMNSPATVQSRLDVIDGHAYWQHPQFPGTPWDPVDWTVANVSMVNTLGSDNTLAALARQRIHGKPFTVTEYNHSQPNYYGAEGPLLLAAYGALQDWDGLWWFDYGPGQDATAGMGRVRGFFDVAQHPGKMANLLLAANLFRRGDVRPADSEVIMALTPEREVDLLLNTWPWNVFSSGQLGVPGKLAFVRRLSTNVGDTPAGQTNPPATPPGNVLTSDTGELRWDLGTPGRGVVTINTPRTRALAGFPNGRAFALGELTLTPGPTRLGWCTLGATLIRGESFTNDATALIVATGWWENTGQVWKDAGKTSVGNQWGRAPVLTEVVPFTLTLPVATNRVRVWALDERGQRRAALPLDGSDAATLLTVTTSTATIWYELEIAPALSGYARWRAENFSPAELADPAISGDQATPAGDGVPNLIKYYSGLPAKTPMPPAHRPQPLVLTLEGRAHLAVSWPRDPAVDDVTCTPEISSDLDHWWSGPEHTAELPPRREGTIERRTAYDRAPMGSAPHRYLRLRYERTGP